MSRDIGARIGRYIPRSARGNAKGFTRSEAYRLIAEFLASSSVEPPPTNPSWIQRACHAVTGVEERRRRNQPNEAAGTLCKTIRYGLCRLIKGNGQQPQRLDRQKKADQPPPKAFYKKTVGVAFQIGP